MTALPSTAGPGFIPPDDLPRVAGAPRCRARVRETPEDFSVEEDLGYALDGEGVHAWLRIIERDVNTERVARELARLAGVRPAAVGYAGLKDRFAVTAQWYSVDLSGRVEPDWSRLDSAAVKVDTVVRHRRKLRRGGHRGNRFRIRLRRLEGDPAELEARVRAVAAGGVPNYFGPQRFGRGYGNVERAAAMLAGTHRVRDRHERGLYLSAARSLLFNRVAARRVEDRTWDRFLPGDVMMPDGSHGTFAPPAADAGLEERLARQAVHPTGPLWGRGERRITARARAVEDAALAGCGSWCEGLEGAGLEADRRALRLRVEGLGCEVHRDGSVTLAFTLGRGGYATVVLRELVGAA